MKYQNVLALAGLWICCAAAFAGAAGTAVDSDHALSAAAQAQIRQDKSKGASHTEQKEDRLSDGTAMDAAQIAALTVRTPAPLTAADFAVGGLHGGDTVDMVKKLYGSPDTYRQSAHYTKLSYASDDLHMRIISRNDIADILKQTGETRKAVRPGVESVFLASGKTVELPRGLRLKAPAEVLLRQFGTPETILRDADSNVYYFVYESPEKTEALVFAIANRKIERVALMPPRLPYSSSFSRHDAVGTRQKKDFSLMGFSVNEPFQANKYNMWTNLIKRESNNFWLYGDYGVEVDRHNTVRKVFLLTNNAYTSRGATLGYHISTILSLYGRPDRVEVGPDKDKSVDAYYYDSPFQKGVSLVFIVKHQEQYVDDVILISEPIHHLQDPMERYGLK